MGAASQLAEHGTPDEAVRSNSIERQRRLRGDCYQGFSDEQEEEGEPSFRLDLGVGERLAQVPEVDTQLLSCNMQPMQKEHSHTTTEKHASVACAKAPLYVLGMSSLGTRVQVDSDSAACMSPDASTSASARASLDSATAFPGEGVVQHSSQVHLLTIRAPSPH